jgi:hypothetical protein
LEVLALSPYSHGDNNIQFQRIGIGLQLVFIVDVVYSVLEAIDIQD